jgi:DDE superfamily endonuclease
VEYWSQVKDIAPNNLVFLDEMGVQLGLMRTHARAGPGERAYDLKPFYRGSKVSVIGAIALSKVLAVMTLKDSMDAAAFEVYVSKCLVPQLWKGAVIDWDILSDSNRAESIFSYPVRYCSGNIMDLITLTTFQKYWNENGDLSSFQRQVKEMFDLLN